MARRRRILRTSTRRLRPVEWGGSLLEAPITVPADGNQRVILTGVFSPPTSFIDEYTQPTLMRIRGSILASRDTPGSVVGAVGIIAQTPDQATLLPTDVSPVTNPELEWIWWHPVIIEKQSLDQDAMHRIDIDSKAMRKLYNGEHLYLYAASNSPLTGYNFAFGLRYLIKE